MNNSVIKKIPLYKKILLFSNLDITDQVRILLKFFVPILILCGFIQYLYGIEIVTPVVTAFVLVVFLLSLPEDNIEVISEKDRFIRIFKMVLNTGIGLAYFMIVSFIIAKVITYGEKYSNTDSDTICYFWFILESIWCILFIWLVIFKYQRKFFLKLSYGEIKSVHTLYVEKKDFLPIDVGSKKIEFRLVDNKRKKMKIGDILIFNNVDDINQFLSVEITKLHYASDFAKLLKQIDINLTGSNNAENILYSLNRIYPKEQQQKRGAIGIEFKSCDLSNLTGNDL
ncbi:MAG: hypothetical protein II830_03040 [Alphaproteobacteria bacterium]|nr:hypothetical protein [Alphaproteobacteria bacterium]